MNLSHLTTRSSVLQHSGSYILSPCHLTDGRGWVTLVKHWRNSNHAPRTKEPVSKSSATAEVFCPPWWGGHPIENNPWQKQSSGHKVWSLQPLALLVHKSWLSYFTEMVDCGTFAPPCSPQITSLCQRGSVHHSLSQRYLFGGKDISLYKMSLLVSVPLEE